MRVALHDADKERIKNKTFPNYALMKLSAWHKARGDIVEWWNPRKRYDRVYSSKIFDFTKENPALPVDTVKGGTGYDLKATLPQEIDDMQPDYSIYPDCDYAIGFLTRGCPNQCPWCVVPEKEGPIRPYRAWEQIARPDTNRLILMDNNILACEHGIEQLDGLARSGLSIDINQGMDIRLVTDETVQLFKKIKWLRHIRFSCDTKSQLPHFERVAALFRKHKLGISKMFVYILVRKDLADADFRVQSLFRISKSISLYAQAERNGRLGTIPTKLQLEFAQRYIYGRLYKKESWPEYCARHGFTQAE